MSVGTRIWRTYVNRSMSLLGLICFLLLSAPADSAQSGESQSIRVDGVIREFAMSPDGRWLCVIAKNKQVLLWDTRTRSSIVLTSTGKHFWGGFSPDSTRLGIFAGGNTHAAWQLRVAGDWARCPEFERFQMPGIIRQRESAVFVPNSTECIALTTFEEPNAEPEFHFEYRGYRCDCRNRKCEPLGIEPLYDYVIDLSISPNGRTLAISRTENIEVFDLATARVLSEQRSWLAKLAFSPDSKLLAAVLWIEPTDDRPNRGEISVCKVENGVRVVEVDLGPQHAQSTVFSSDGRRLVFADASQAIFVLPIRTGARPVSVSQDRRVDAVQRLDDQRFIAFQQEAGTLTWWDATSSLIAAKTATQ